MSFPIEPSLLKTPIVFKGKPKTQEDGVKTYSLEKTLLCYVERAKVENNNFNISLEDTTHIVYTNSDLEDFIGGIALFDGKTFQISSVKTYKEPFDDNINYSRGALKWLAF